MLSCGRVNLARDEAVATYGKMSTKYGKTMGKYEKMLSCGEVNLARDEAVCVPARLGTKPQTVSQPQTDFIPFNTKQQTGNTKIQTFYMAGDKCYQFQHEYKSKK